MLNPFFLQGSKSEQGLIQDLINEQLRMYGVEIHYLPRNYITEKTVIKEVIESEFNNAYPIEAYVDTYDGYNDNPTILSKFGIQALNEITLTISRERFSNYISPLIENKPNIKLNTRPKEGDLVYFPLGKRLFEIKYVEHEKPFYQLQGLYTYQLRCELFRYEDEVIDTSVDEIDNLISGESVGSSETAPVGNITNLTMAGVAVTATAMATIVNGGVTYITVTNRGGGYSSAPTVAISSAPSGGKTATAVAELIGGIVVCNQNIGSQSKSVQSVKIVNSGYGYTSVPQIRFIGGDGKGATGIASIGTGVVGIVSISNSGSGYILPPPITFTGICTVSAAATAVVSAGGSITAIYLTNTGLGYTQAPIITIGDPNLTSSGDFVFNEIVTGSQSGITARVRSWNSTNNVLQVSRVDGGFILGESIIGSESGAIHYLKSISTPPVEGRYSSNDEIEQEADDIIDFSEINPFGMP